MVKEEEEEESETLVDERKDYMLPFIGGKPTLRTARFLKPSVKSIHEAAQVPVFSKTLGYEKLVKCPSKVFFRGWRHPMKKWKQWVDLLLPLYKPLWEQIGIYESIMSSTSEIRRDSSLFFGLAELWCPETNTFIFPWGEATMTLEDMLILGGFSVLGKPVCSPLESRELEEIEEEMIEEHRRVGSGKSKKAAHQAWMNHFMESGSKLEHMAFLSLWLSRYVFPAFPFDTTRKGVFLIAINLARGTQMALAPAVLATLYRDLRFLKEQVMGKIGDSDSNSGMPITLGAPLQLMQLWAWERFPILQPKLNNLQSCEPISTRWHKSSSKLKLESVRMTMNSANSFQWRPYAPFVENCQSHLFYREKEEWVSNGSSLDKELQSFARFLRVCELVGLDCIEQYLPHRVAMQFGMDQDLPGDVPRVNVNSEVAWETYDKPTREAKLYIPSRHFESDVTTRYFEWRKRSMSGRQDAVKDIFEKKKNSEVPKRVPQKSNGNHKESYGSAPPGFHCKYNKVELQDSSDEDALTISDMSRLRRKQVSPGKEAASSAKPSSGTQSQSIASLITKSDVVRKRNSSMLGTESAMEMDNERKLRSRVLNPLSTNDYKEGEKSRGTTQVPGLELEARICRLEILIAGLKAKVGSKVERKPTRDGPSPT
ncbi:hypothetical protein HHK36_003240 [Tetracentron sinense]|uniref:Aminotransferase-like plant mobile domain-containing protein n=1 Tax=Tetracentron sinense TaxID=13715 RepID=A0A834ZX91_TETSI|nr:hypothetical protein HHK36_003240 [Tetracentron sinense]